MPPAYNSNNPAIKRIMREAREINEAGPNPDFSAAPEEDNVFEVQQRFLGPRLLVWPHAEALLSRAVALHHPRASRHGV